MGINLVVNFQEGVKHEIKVKNRYIKETKWFIKSSKDALNQTLFACKILFFYRECPLHNKVKGTITINNYFKSSYLVILTNIFVTQSSCHTFKSRNLTDLSQQSLFNQTHTTKINTQTQTDWCRTGWRLSSRRTAARSWWSGTRPPPTEPLRRRMRTVPACHSLSPCSSAGWAPTRWQGCGRACWSRYAGSPWCAGGLLCASASCLKIC